MQQSIHDFQNLLKDKNIIIKNKNFEEILYKFDFIFYPDIFQAEKGVLSYENNSKIIIIDECTQNDVKYYILCFEYKLIILPCEDQKRSSNLKDILHNFDDCDKYYIQNCGTQSETDIANKNFFSEIQNFSNEFKIRNKQFKSFWNNVVNCLSGFLIKKAYQNSRKKYGEHLNDPFDEYKEENAANLDMSYLELRNIGGGNCGTVCLIYYISKEEIFAMKLPNSKSVYLIERERNNYLSIRYPFIVPYIGFIQPKYLPKYLLLGYVEGKTLDKYELDNLNDQEKYIIIFELLLTIHYIHSQNYIYRDLRLNNIMINQSKDAILIDFDSVLKVGDLQTKDFDDQVVAPEENKTFKSDVYSLGYIIHFILYGKAPIINNKMDIKEDFILKSCLERDPTKRPNIIEVINTFFANFFAKIKGYKKQYLISLALMQKIPEAQFDIGIFYYHKQDIKMAIPYLSLAANQNHAKAQYTLSVIYLEGRYVPQDINKAINYLGLAAKQNIPEAQYNLGVIYLNGQYVKLDINKAIHYFTLASDQNIPQAQYNLGNIYDSEQYVTRDINKAIHYYTLAANHNHPLSLHNLGIIYLKRRDINKAIHYLSLASNQNIPQAQYELAIIYYKGQYVKQDINKAIYYFTLAANKNHPESLYNLAIINLNGRYVTRDINKAIHYFTLAAEQNNPRALYDLSVIYYNGQYIKQDINKAIHYLSLAANENHPESQYNIGVLYFNGQYVKRDINKAIHYLSLASSQNFSQAHYILGIIYYIEPNVKQDINKAIHYLTLAANQNIPQAHYILGIIYYNGRYVTQDIYKAIHYFTLAANQNHPQAQHNLGTIYYYGLCVTQDINKAIHYFTLAANQNVPQAQYNLGIIYSDGQYITQDVNKEIYYFTLAANQKYLYAQYNLGVIYYNGLGVARDINKAIHYFTLAANQSQPKAQFILGCIYYTGLSVRQYIKKGTYLIILASKNKNRQANFAHGFLLHEGKYVKKNILEAIHYYKEASSFNNQYSKNNLGIIYKHGYNEIKRNISNAIIYFEEGIQQKNDYLSMYNLAHIYIYDETIKQDLNKSIDLLLRSMDKFEHSFILLCLALLLKFEFNVETIKQELSKRNDITEMIIDKILAVLGQYKLYFNELYELYRHKDYLYNITLNPILSSELEHIDKKVIKPKYPNAKDLSPEFYEGFGY